MGTVGYVPPEQVLGHETVSRVDIFALGVMLNEVMSGRRPFSGESAVEVMHAVLKEDPPDLSEANPKLSVLFVRIVPTDRTFSSGFATRIRSLLSGPCLRWEGRSGFI